MNTGGAWLSSVRVVKCWVKSRNERNPHLFVAFILLTKGTAIAKWRKERMKSSQYAPYTSGYTLDTMALTKSSNFVRTSKSQKQSPSSDCRLKLVDMKLELQVIVGQLYNGEYVLGFYTYRTSH